MPHTATGYALLSTVISLMCASVRAQDAVAQFAFQIPRCGYCYRSSIETQCDAGYFCPIGATQYSPIVPILCPGGFYCPAGSCEPKKCTCGHKCPPGSSAETNCMPPFYCPNSGATNQTLCPLGHKCHKPEMCTPEKCPLGTFVSCAGKVRCDPCPARRYCPNVTHALLCPAGHFCPERSSAPQPCCEGQTCPLGSEFPALCLGGCAAVTTVTELISNAILLTIANRLTSTLFTTTDYSVALLLKLSQVTATSRSILHFTATDADQGAYSTRIPAIFTVPGQPRLRIVLDTQTALGQGCPASSRAIPLNQWITVVLHVRGNRGVAYINGVAEPACSITGPRAAHSGVRVYASDPWRLPAVGWVSRVRYFAIAA
jgi:hypothetical protein